MAELEEYARSLLAGNSTGVFHRFKGQGCLNCRRLAREGLWIVEAPPADRLCSLCGTYWESAWHARLFRKEQGNG